jgi:nucleotide-binding universal stress UspA family protein
MFQKILVPLDGSARAERALPVAAQIARSRNAKLILLRVVSELADVGGYMIPSVVTDNGTIEREEFEARDYLSSLAKHHMFQGIKVETLVEFGLPAQVILDTVKSLGADGVIIGSHGRTGLSRWMLGSVAQPIVRHSSVPVLLLRQQGPALDEDGLSERPFRILVPLDGSEVAEAALEPAQILGEVLAGKGSYELHLARVIPFLNTSSPDKLREESRVDALNYLDRVTKRLSESGSRAHITTSVILEVDVADAIARMTRAGELVTGSLVSDGCDLIAMATHGRTGLARLAMGSVTERVLSATIAPALIIRPETMKVEKHTPETLTEQEKNPEPQSWPALF